MPPIILGGVIRWTQSGVPYLLNDPAHHSAGLADIRVINNTLIEIMYQEPLEGIVTAWVSPDETFVGLGVMAGPSVGLDRVVLKVAQHGTAIPINSPVLRTPNSNLWLGIIGYST